MRTPDPEIRYVYHLRYTDRMPPAFPSFLSLYITSPLSLPVSPLSNPILPYFFVFCSLLSFPFLICPVAIIPNHGVCPVPFVPTLPYPARSTIAPPILTTEYTMRQTAVLARRKERGEGRREEIP